VPRPTSGTQVSYTATDLKAETPYYFRVWAYNASGPSNVVAGQATTGKAAVGTGTGLVGRYYDDKDFTVLKGTHANPPDAQVNFNWGSTAPVSGMLATDYTVRWTGQVEA